MAPRATAATVLRRCVDALRRAGRRTREWCRRWALTIAIAALAGVVVYALANWLFPYRSINHDEGVYLTQAAMLLEGQLHLFPPVPEAFRPWFFVRDGAAFYPKYGPVPAAMFAPGLALGDATLSLAGIGAVVVGLQSAVVRELFDRRSGLLAACGLLATPLFVIQASVFLPYVATAVWLLAFALGYLRADRTGSHLAAAGAGVAIGVAVLARPYTALLFGAPFVGHALWRCWRRRGAGLVHAIGLPRAIVAVGGLLGVSATLAYNAHLTGDPRVFPYEAFGPRDGVGFGSRALLGHEVTYTPALAFESNARALAMLGEQWFVAGVLGAVLAGVGCVVTLGAWLRPRAEARRGAERSRQLAFLGVLGSVVLGQLAFWGTFNALGPLAEHLGPYYHLPGVLVGVALAARAIIAIVDRIRRFAHAHLSAPGRLSDDRTEHLAASVLVIGAILLTVAAGATLADPIRDNAAYSDRLETAYEPVEDRTFDRALVFLPTPYGEWLNHPFQYLRNEPGYGGRVVYALEERPFAVSDAFPKRSLYRYQYRGRWAPGTGERVEPTIQRVRVVEGESVNATVRVGLPAATERVSIRLASPEGATYDTAESAAAERAALSMTMTVTPGEATLDGPLRASRNGSVPLDGGSTLVLSVFADYGTGGGVHYRFRTPVQVRNGSVRVMTPERVACTRPRRCGEEGAAIVPRSDLPEGVEASVRLGSSPQTQRRRPTASGPSEPRNGYPATPLRSGPRDPRSLAIRR